MSVWRIVAYPQGSPDAPPVAVVTTRSLTLSQDITAWFIKQGFGATRAKWTEGGSVAAES